MTPDASPQPPSLQGLVANRDDEQALCKALEQAFDYRGDITITTTAGQEITGYLFDRHAGATLDDSSLRVLTPTDDAPITIGYRDIASVAFTGKDAAHGKSFDTWIKKYTQKKLAGEEASIFSETSD